MSAVEAAPRTVVRTEPAYDDAPPTHGWTGWRIDVGRTFLVFALLVAWVLVYLTLLSPIEQRHAQRELYEQFRTELALATAPVGAPIDAGRPVALLSIPRVGMKDEMVVEGTGARQLKNGPGHLRGTVLPGQSGTSVLLGKALSFGAPFGSLDQLRVGDPITVTTGQGTFVYHVRGARHRGDPAPAPPAGSAGRLTLVTGLGSGWLAHYTPSDTIYFDADLDKGVGPGLRSTKVANEQPMTTDIGAGTLAELALALQLLLAAFVGTGWARLRWSKQAAWLVGVPSILAALWLVSSLGALLLPNLV